MFLRDRCSFSTLPRLKLFRVIIKLIIIKCQYGKCSIVLDYTYFVTIDCVAYTICFLILSKKVIERIFLRDFFKLIAM